jgi:hypothetical protein
VTEATGHRILTVQELGDGEVCPSGCPSTANQPPVQCSNYFLTWVGLTCQHPNPGWVADGPEIVIRAVRERAGLRSQMASPGSTLAGKTGARIVPG